MKHMALFIVAFLQILTLLLLPFTICIHAFPIAIHRAKPSSLLLGFSEKVNHHHHHPPNRIVHIQRYFHPHHSFGYFNHISSSSHSSQKDHNNDETNINTNTPSFIQSPVLREVYPAMLQHLQEYGNPNIPLGSSNGKKCKTLRRLAFQKKLTREEMELLDSIQFRLNSFEDVYEEADFDHCLERLIMYENEHKNNYQIPKKYKPDPELGAWVTMIRRIGRDNIDPERREKLTKINFAWVSTRKCGSAFMSNYRPLKERLYTCCVVNEANDTMVVVDEEELQRILSEPEVNKWIRAQAGAARNGNLSDARCDYMDQLPGFNWRDL